MPWHHHKGRCGQALKLAIFTELVFIAVSRILYEILSCKSQWLTYPSGLVSYFIYTGWLMSSLLCCWLISSLLGPWLNVESASQQQTEATTPAAKVSWDTESESTRANPDHSWSWMDSTGLESCKTTKQTVFVLLVWLWTNPQKQNTSIKELSNVQKLAQLCQKFHLDAELNKLGPGRLYQVPQLRWLTGVHRNFQPPSYHTQDPIFPHLPKISWPMKVHRRSAQ